jgi:hypothetical protein
MPKQSGTDLTGAWKLAVESPLGTTVSVLFVKHSGKQLTGNYVGRFGETPVTGTVADDKIALEGADDRKTLRFSGVVNSEGALTGSLEIALKARQAAQRPVGRRIGQRRARARRRIGQGGAIPPVKATFVAARQ